MASETLRHLPYAAFQRVRVAALIADTYSAGETDYAFTFNPFDSSATQRLERVGRGAFGAASCRRR